jgi:hypothetical protein
VDDVEEVDDRQDNKKEGSRRSVGLVPFSIVRRCILWHAQFQSVY